MNDDRLLLSQVKYSQEILKRFNMTECKPISTPYTNNKLLLDDGSNLVDATLYRQLVGSLMYLRNTRLDISYSVGILSQFMIEPREVHWREAKRVLRYIKGTSSLCLQYLSDSEFGLCGFVDADWAGDPATQKSTTGYCFSIGSVIISWSSKRQQSVALSSTKEEYITTSLASCEAM
eukprot:Gb_11409 [translate_table: standard]